MASNIVLDETFLCGRTTVLLSRKSTIRRFRRANVLRWRRFRQPGAEPPAEAYVGRSTPRRGAPGRIRTRLCPQNLRNVQRAQRLGISRESAALTVRRP